MKFLRPRINDAVNMIHNGINRLGEVIAAAERENAVYTSHIEGYQGEITSLKAQIDANDGEIDRAKRISTRLQELLS